MSNVFIVRDACLLLGEGRRSVLDSHLARIWSSTTIATATTKNPFLAELFTFI